MGSDNTPLVGEAPIFVGANRRISGHLVATLNQLWG